MEAQKAAPTFGKKKKLNRADFMFKDKANEVLIKRPGDLNGLDFMIKDLEGCTVVILDHTAQVTVDRCNNCKFYIGPIKASIFFRNCDGCEITVASS
jgi:protein XRP2